MPWIRQAPPDGRNRPSIAKVKALHYEMAMHYARGDQPGYFRLNQKIHETIMEITTNLTLLQVYRSLAERIHINKPLGSSHAGARSDLGGIGGPRRDATRPADLLKAHLLNKQAAVKKVLKAKPE